MKRTLLAGLSASLLGAAIALLWTGSQRGIVLGVGAVVGSVFFALIGSFRD